MSIGIGAFAKKVAEDKKMVMYEYGGYNLNDSRYRNAEHLSDGTITILKECFVEPEIHKKIKRQPFRKKKIIIKKIPIPVDYGKLLECGQIVVDNCSICWRITDNELKVDVMACRLLNCIFLRYQEDGEVPESVSYNV